MKPLPEYVFITPNASAPEMGAGYILQTVSPYYLGRIIKLSKDPFALTNYRNEFKPLIYAEVPGYQILIVFAGNLSGYKVQVSGTSWESELQQIFDGMAEWFLKEKIGNNRGYYKRYLTDWKLNS